MAEAKVELIDASKDLELLQGRCLAYGDLIRKILRSVPEEAEA